MQRDYVCRDRRTVRRHPVPPGVIITAGLGEGGRALQIEAVPSVYRSLVSQRQALHADAVIWSRRL